ncbi:hypothetical protein [Streptococcus sp. sy018]|uniref:hypothetical protein n=1 Tax=Streptococcus sp. sy018 TaxID=2600147 RepID=UPI0011B37A55|nr:hypothetical protein [Streptococcus sp. sy018]TWS95561.1 hypothetical protein FRX52_01815 [Streptococcus sp. sy018]
MYRFIIDAETDGLYGQLLTLAVLISDTSGNVIEEFYAGLPHALDKVTNHWVKEHVLPYVNDYQAFDCKNDLLNAFWQLWLKYHNQETLCFVDVGIPVEASIWHQVIQLDVENRTFLAPFPIIDISSLLLAKGYNPLISRQELVPSFSGHLHNALDDVRLANAVLTKIL